MRHRCAELPGRKVGNGIFKDETAGPKFTFKDADADADAGADADADQDGAAAAENDQEQ